MNALNPYYFSTTIEETFILHYFVLLMKKSSYSFFFTPLKQCGEEENDQIQAPKNLRRQGLYFTSYKPQFNPEA